MVLKHVYLHDMVFSFGYFLSPGELLHGLFYELLLLLLPIPVAAWYKA